MAAPRSIAISLVVATTMTMPVVLRAQHEPAAQPASAKPPAPASKPSDVKSIVDRIQKRIAEEVPARPGQTPAAQASSSGGRGASTIATGGGAARTTARAARTTDPVRPRVQLEWRLSLIWPAELTQ